MKSRANVYETITYDDLRVHAYGDTAIATGIAVLKGTAKGKPVDGSVRWTDTWIKRAGQWQCVASQGTMIAKK
jgi:ketosteroid isomerase-like protein